MHMTAHISMRTALLVASLSTSGCAALQKDDDRVDRDRLTDGGTSALARALAAADPTDRPTLERLRDGSSTGGRAMTELEQAQDVSWGCAAFACCHLLCSITCLQTHSIATLDVLAHKQSRHSTVLAMIER